MFRVLGHRRFSTPLIRNATVFLVLAVVAFVTYAALDFSSAKAVGRGIWTFEQFGSEVAILRAAAIKSLGQDRDVSVLISCSGPDRRVRLSLPVAIAKTETSGSAIIMTPRQPEPAKGVIVRFILHKTSEIVISETADPDRDIAVLIGQMLLTKPRALDMVVSLGVGSATLTHLQAYRLFLPSAPEDIDAVSGFIQACERSAVRSVH